MVQNSTKYRYVFLLSWAMAALVLNPVWHAASHFSLNPEHGHPAKDHSDHQWYTQDACPYCDAVIYYTEIPTVEIPIVKRVILWKVDQYEQFRDNQGPFLRARLRAPPAIT